jgi:nickel-dependent lactate racemase
VGRTRPGRKVEFNRLAVEADRLILTGGVTVHSLAGFSGGPKSLLPGIASAAAIQANHGLAFDPAGRVRAGVAKGRTQGNPVAEEMARAASLIKVDLALNVVVGAAGRYLGAWAGPRDLVPRAAARAAGEYLFHPAPPRSGLVLTSAGGWPRDAQLYQAVKALDNAADLVGPGGTLIFLAQAESGAGPEEFVRCLELPDQAPLAARLRERFTVPGFIALKVKALQARGRVILVSGLAADLVGRLGFTPAASLAEALALAGRRPDQAYALPQAGLTVFTSPGKERPHGV